MIVSFSVSNFLSFAGEQTFSLLASAVPGSPHSDHLTDVPDSEVQALRVGVIYGANGAGKSNLFRALGYLRDLATTARPRNSGTGRVPFRFGGLPHEPSVLDIQFSFRDGLYRYGCAVNDESVVQEWLAQVVGGVDRTIFERTTSEDGDVRVSGPAAGERMDALMKVGGPANQTFLSTIGANLRPEDAGGAVTDVLEWFRVRLGLIAPDEVLSTLGSSLQKDSGLREFAGDFLRSCSTGVDSLEVVASEVAEDEVRRGLSGWRLQELTATGRNVRLSDGSEIVHDSGKFYRMVIHARHQFAADVGDLELAEESDGTRRLLDLVPALYQLRTAGGLLFIDEIDRSMHPHLVRRFVEYFLEKCAGEGRQLILTTHESNLLDLSLLRRDEIWFAEKDTHGATNLYSLLEFPERDNQDIRKHYLQGRFGAIPFPADFDRLVHESPAP